MTSDPHPTSHGPMQHPTLRPRMSAGKSSFDRPRRRAWLATTLLGLLAAGCATVEESPDEEVLSPDELMELIRQGQSGGDVEWADGEIPAALDPDDPNYERVAKAIESGVIRPGAVGLEAVAVQDGEGAEDTGAPQDPGEGSGPTEGSDDEGSEDPGMLIEDPPPTNLGPLSAFSENPYLTFGRRIIVYPDGTITKPFPMRLGTAKRMEAFIKNYGNFPIWDPAVHGDGPSTPNMVKIDLEEGWDVELTQDLANVKDQGKPVTLADWLLVTAGEDLLLEVEDFINLFAAGVPQIEIEAKVVEITFNESLDIGIRPRGQSIINFPSHTFLGSLNYDLPNVATANEALLAFGAVQDGLAFNAVLEALAARDNVSIISQPRIAVREGGRASIENTLRIPFVSVTAVTNNGGFNTKVEYQEIGVQLYVVPRVVGTDTVALDVDINASQQSGSSLTVATSEGGEIFVPNLSRRRARTTVYLQPGQAVIIGGLITERTVERVRKVPLLGDVPLLRHLFRSKFDSTEQSNVLFFIRPRILQGSDFSRDF